MLWIINDFLEIDSIVQENNSPFIEPIGSFTAANHPIVLGYLNEFIK